MRSVQTTFAFLFCLIIKLAFSQTTVTWTDLITNDRESNISKKFYATEKYVYYFTHPRGDGDHFYLDAYDASSLKPAKRIEMWPELERLDSRYYGVRIINHQLVCLRYKYDGKLKGYVLFGKAISEEGEPSPEVKLAVIDGGRDATFNVVASDDSDFMVLMEKNPKDNQEAMTTITLFDAKLNVIVRKVVPLSSKNQRFKSKDFFIGKIEAVNQNAIYFMVGFKKEKAKDEPDEFFNVYRFDPEKESLNEIKVDVDEKYLHPDFKVNENGNLVVTGTYSEGDINPDRSKKEYSIAGTFYYRTDIKSSTHTVKKVNPFGTEFLSSFDRSDLTNDEKEVYTLSFDDAVFNSDNSVAIVGQQSYRIRNQDTGQNQHYADNMFVVTYDSVGGLVFEKAIQKSQHGIDKTVRYVSYDFFYFDKTCYFLFNETKSNSWGESNCNLVKLDRTGNVTVTLFMKNDGRKQIFSTETSWQNLKLGTGEVFIYSANDKYEYRIGKLILK